MNKKLLNLSKLLLSVVDALIQQQQFNGINGLFMQPTQLVTIRISILGLIEELESEVQHEGE